MAAQKNLWHSELVGLGQVVVTIKTGPTKSKYPNKPDYVTLLINGTERYYQIETQMCADFFKARVGQTLLIEGRDSRENASVHAMGPATGQQPAGQTQNAVATPAQNNPPPPNSQTATTPASTAGQQPGQQTAPKDEPKKKTKEEQAAEALAKKKDNVLEFRKTVARSINAFKLIDAGIQALNEYRTQQNRAMTPEEMSSKSTTIFIQLQRSGKVDSLPYDEIEKYLPEPKAKA